ncbi:hypothetical protein GCM10023084_26740 [Streptomyces lacrimifluminis]
MDRHLIGGQLEEAQSAEIPRALRGLLGLGPQTNDEDDLTRYWYTYATGANGDYWDTPVGEGDNLSMACYGRAGCQAAYNYLLKTHDVSGAKKLAAAYCLHNAEQCASDARLEAIVNETMQESLELIALGLGGGKYGCKCFLAGTDVLMADGKTKDIEDVEVGDKVVATDPETGKTGPRKVTHLIVTDGDKYFNDLYIATKDGVEHLTATHEHPFWSPSERKWMQAGALTPGMTLLTDDGSTVIVTGNRAYTQHARTYNLTVDDLHTYYVLAGQTPVLVHNSNCPNGKLSDPLPRGMNNKIASAYDDVQAGRIPSHDTYGGREHPWWAGSKEYRVPGRPETDRILEKELPNGVKVYGWTSTHYTKIQRFSAPHFPDSGWN